MKKMFYLSSCSTCAAIIKKTGIAAKGFQMQDIKIEKITAEQLDALKTLAGTYEALFSKRAMKYKELGLKNQPLQENDFRKLILEEYTFLKRPVVIDGTNLFIGSEQQNIKQLLMHFGQSDK